MDDKHYPDLSELVGKKVVRRDMVIFEDDEDFSEVGIIVHAWLDHELSAMWHSLEKLGLPQTKNQKKSPTS